jgi:hypothetical protein
MNTKTTDSAYTPIAFSGKNILVVGIVKDVESSISKDISRIEAALESFDSVRWFLVESNSQDQTREKLQSIKGTKDNFNFALLEIETLPPEFRTESMAKARNRYLREIRSNHEYADIDFVAIADFNGLNSKLVKTAIDSCLENQEWDACFANQKGRYYDIWALRHRLWSPNDCWEELKFYRRYIRFPELALFKSVTARMIRIQIDSPWIEVESAFGGFGIYKRFSMDSGEYFGKTTSGIQICEHVPFHETLRQNGSKLFINPKMINTKWTDHSRRATFPFKAGRVIAYPFKFLSRFFN